MPDESPEAFYDGLAADYHTLFDDWWQAACAHADVIERILRAHDVEPPATVLDCACGIGTQALPLAQRGYRVTGTDVSAEALARARTEARERDITITLAHADMRALDVGTFDAVIACDNALPHLLDDDDLDAALKAIKRSLTPNGAFIASVRDYDALKASGVTGVPGQLRRRDGEREITGQAWEWQGDQVRIHLFVVREHAPDKWSTAVHTTWYRALGRTDLRNALVRAGFTNTQWLEPDDSGYYQPIVTARRD